MRPARMTSFRVAVPFALAAALWGIFVNYLLASELRFFPSRYDYFLDLAFAALVGLLLSRAVSRELLKRAAAQQAEVTQVWRAANATLESRVAERTAELEQANEALQAEIAERARTEQELTSLLELSCLVASTLDLQRLLGVILAHAEKTIGYSSASLWRYDGGT
jgi:Tfp pilus assembly protein FimV